MKKERIQINYIVLTLIVLVLIFINAILYMKYILIPKNEQQDLIKSRQNNQTNQVNNEDLDTVSEEEKELNNLKKMNERGRMEFYFAEFISYIKEENYSEAYNLLYPEFRENYFKTLEDFTKYVKKLYPKSVAFSYNDIERQGYIYVLVIEVIDPTKKVGEGKSQRIVIHENDFNDFVLSFQVI